MKLITLHLTTPQVKKLNILVSKHFYPNKSEAIRFAINDLIELHEKHLT